MEQANKNYFVSMNLLIVITFLVDWSLAEEFSYKDELFWPQKFPDCGGKFQSPVSLEYSQYDGGDQNATFSMINYHQKASSVKLSNIGHTIKLDFVWDKEPPYVASGFFGEEEYVFDSMHFHWSRVSKHGSEHVILGVDGAMEMHLLHYNRRYGSVKNSMNQTDGLILIGALVNTNAKRRRRDMDGDSNDNNNLVLASPEKSPAISEILGNVGSVKTPGSSVDIEPFAVSDVRPEQLNQSPYLAYFGSYSSPPCTEGTLRVMSTYPYEITEEQFKYLQSTVEFSHGDDHNNRPIQPMNGRQFSILWGVAETSD